MAAPFLVCSITEYTADRYRNSPLRTRYFTQSVNVVLTKAEIENRMVLLNNVYILNNVHYICIVNNSKIWIRRKFRNKE